MRPAVVATFTALAAAAVPFCFWPLLSFLSTSPRREGAYGGWAWPPSSSFQRSRLLAARGDRRLVLYLQEATEKTGRRHLLTIR